MDERDFIYEELQRLIPDISRRECTPRVMAPVDFLLDQLLELEVAADFDRVFGS